MNYKLEFSSQRNILGQLPYKSDVDNAPPSTLSHLEAASVSFSMVIWWTHLRWIGVVGPIGLIIIIGEPSCRVQLTIVILKVEFKVHNSIARSFFVLYSNNLTVEWFNKGLSISISSNSFPIVFIFFIRSILSESNINNTKVRLILNQNVIEVLKIVNHISVIAISITRTPTAILRFEFNFWLGKNRLSFWWIIAGI